MTDTTAHDTATARIAFLRGLRAVRQLRPDPLPESVLHDILEVARWSGSAGNRQSWEFVVVRDRDVLVQLARVEGANAGHLATAAAGIAIVIRPEVPDLDAYDEGRLAERGHPADVYGRRLRPLAEKTGKDFQPIIVKAE